VADPRAGQRTILVPVPAPAAAPEVARALLDAEGVRLIELCGAFTLADAANVAKAVEGKVPVGHVTFAVDSVPGTAALAAAYESAT
jgi:ABC-type enterobactin transport system permease subunit